jgi:hypothetical protein
MIAATTNCLSNSPIESLAMIRMAACGGGHSAMTRQVPFAFNTSNTAAVS